METHGSLDEATRRQMVAAYDEAVARGEVSPPELMNDEGRRRFHGLVRDGLLAGTPDTLFQALADGSLWTMYKFGIELSGFGMQPTDWMARARRVSDEMFLRFGGGTGQGGEPIAGQPAPAVSEPEPAEPSEPFRLTSIHHHPRYPSFFIQVTPGYLWFTNVPGGADTSVEVARLPEGAWLEVPDAAGRTIPVTVLRQPDGTLLARWL